MSRVKAVTIGWQCLAVFGVALFAINIGGAQEVKQSVQPPPPVTVVPRPAPVAVPVPPDVAGQFQPMQTRLNVVIDPKTPLADLLPVAPKNRSKLVNRILDDLKMVPEVTFQEALSSKLSTDKATIEIAHQLAKMRHVDLKKTDGFLQALIDHREDLQGMPFAMGEACRTVGPRATFLAGFSIEIRRCVANASEKGPVPLLNPEKLWTALFTQLQAAEPEMAKLHGQFDQDECESAIVAAMMQVLTPESPAVRLGLVRYLSKTPHVDATKALARLAMFSAEDEVRLAAVQALKLRREKDYTPILLEGFRYPLPQVAKRASEALVRLGCTDTVPQLVELLDEADPRLPVTTETQGKKVTKVKEIVRVNHHRNCMLCHAPADPESGGGLVPGSPLTTALGAAGGDFAGAKGNVLVSTAQPVPAAVPSPTVQAIPAPVPEMMPSPNAQVPLPNQPLPSFSDGGYGQGGPRDIMVRFDVTYLRQDFSLYMPVHDAAPWPDMQRFDFLVRSRVLSAKETEEYQQHAPKAVAGATTPYQRAILFALRELTQRDTAPTPQAWRELLALPGKSGSS